MSTSISRRLAALESTLQRIEPPRRPCTPEEAQAAYDWLMAPQPPSPAPYDGLTPAERYMRMLNGPMAKESK